jgi:hypothetical protein
MNLIYGSNQIYNHEEYINYIKEYFKGNSGIIKGNNNFIPKVKVETSDEDNDSREVLTTEKNPIQYLNESKEQKINVNSIINNKNSIINTENIKMSYNTNKDTINYDLGPVANSVIKPQGQNIRNSIDTNDDYYISDYK